MTNIEDVIRDVALKNRQSVTEDDPVMALVTIMTRVAADWQVAMDAALEKHLASHEDLANRWRRNMPAQAQAVINAALKAGTEAMAKGMNEGAEKVLEAVRKQERDVLRDILRSALLEQKAELEAAAAKFRRYYLWMIAGNGAVMLLALFIAACL